MESTVSKLSKEYPFTFTAGTDFHWSPEEQTIYYVENGDETLLFHEVGHALLDHKDYDRDISLLAMERDAWEEARTLTPIDDVVIQDHLDTYREWLHARSTCPNCSANGQQVRKFEYHCVACGTDWRVNEARLCGLKRYRL